MARKAKPQSDARKRARKADADDDTVITALPVPVTGRFPESLV
jgi:hypothetical protein